MFQCVRESTRSTMADIWIDCFCINQHRVKEQRTRSNVVETDSLAKVFGEQVSHIGKMLALMTPWHAPNYLKRIW